MFTHEIISYQKNLPLKLYFQRIGDVAKHWHQSMELLFVLQGEATVIVESEASYLKEGDIILINPQQIHETHGEGCIIAMLQIRLSMFHGPNLYENAQFNCNSSLYQNKARFANLLKLIAKLIQINSTVQPLDRSSLLTISLAYAIMHELMINFFVPDGTYPVNTHESLQRIKDITTYLDAHYMENISLKSVAEQQFLSASYLSHFFEKTMGMTFSAYLTSIRLDHAYRELMTTEHYIEDIAANNGFPNSRAFVTAFRKQYHMLPSQYREDTDEHQRHASILDESKGQNYLELEKHDFLRILNQYLDKNAESPMSSPEPIHTVSGKVIDTAKKGTPLRHTFRVFTSVGRASDLLQAEIQDMLRIQQQEIGYRYIKFHGILDDAMMLYREDKDGQPLLNFSYVDKILDFLLSIGLRPLIQFSFMPRELAADPNRLLFAQPVIISPPKDEGKWCFLVESLTHHFMERYGRGEVRQWLFTFWNETLGSTPFSIGDFDISCCLYELTWKSVKKVDSSLRFGNPSALATHFPEQGFVEFMGYCQKHGCMPDIHILHFYPITRASAENFGKLKPEDFVNLKDNNTITLSEDPDLMGKFIQSYLDYAKDYPGIPAYLTEWCSTSSHRDFLNDTCFRSAYICKNVLENYDKLESFGNWTLTDFIEELPLEDSLFHGGMGVFTRNGIKKPAYYAFLFLGRLKDTLLGQGDGYFVTGDGQGNYTILLYNYNHYSSLYAQGILFDADPESRYEVFGDTHVMDIELTLEHMADGHYILRESIVNRNYGSCYDEWVRMGAEPLTTTEEVALLKSRSVPMMLKSKLDSQDGRICYFAHLEPHEIRLAEIERRW